MSYFVNDQDLVFIIKKSGDLFFGNKPACLYWQDTYTRMPQGLKETVNKTKRDFVKIKQLMPDVQELHFVESKTRGTRLKPGHPQPGYGYAWCRVKFNNGKFGQWVFLGDNKSVYVCSKYVKPGDYIQYLIHSEFFRSALLRHPVASEQKQNTEQIVYGIKSDKPTIITHTVAENLERIANSLETIANVLQAHFNTQR